MAFPNNNINDQKHSRFLDADQEPRKMMQPIEGYQYLPLLPLEEAVEPIIALCPDIYRRVYIAKENCQAVYTNMLTEDEAASIYLYTMEWKPRSECLYMALNTVLRSENRDVITPWFLYLKLILTAFTRIPSSKMVIWRGVKANLSHKYEIDKVYVWWSFSSCTESLAVLKSNIFLGTSGERTLFNIDCKNGKIIAPYSRIPTEKEVILLPATQFIVKGKLNPSPGLHIIQLQEIDPPFPLLELPSVSSDSESEPITESTKSYLKIKQRIARCLPDCMYIGESNITDRDVPFIVKRAIGERRCSFLDLNHNIITAQGAQLIANVLHQNTSLKTLRFWHNHLLDSGASYIVQALCSNTALTTLCLASNGLTDTSASDIARMLKENQTLTTLYLDHNGIGDEGMIILMNAFRYNETLQKLCLHNNAITDQSIDAIKKMFIHSHTLKILSLGDNQLSKKGEQDLRNLAERKNGFQFYV